MVRAGWARRPPCHPHLTTTPSSPQWPDWEIFASEISNVRGQIKSWSVTSCHSWKLISHLMPQLEAALAVLGPETSGRVLLLNTITFALSASLHSGPSTEHSSSVCSWTRRPAPLLSLSKGSSAGCRGTLLVLVLTRQWWEDCCTFKPNLGYMVKPTNQAIKLSQKLKGLCVPYSEMV